MALIKKLGSGFWEACGAASLPGMDRRLLFLWGDRIGYRTTLFPLLVPFIAHTAFALGILFAGPICLVRLCLGFKDVPPLAETLVIAAFGIPFGGLFASFLVPLTLGRQATVLDRGRRRVREVRGLALPLVPMLPVWSHYHKWDKFDTVVLRLASKEMGKGSTTEVYSIRLVHGGQGDVKVVDALRYLTARAHAEAIAEFMDLPLRDTTGLRPVVRTADRLDLPLADQNNFEHKLPPVPDASRVEVTDDGRELNVLLPPARFTHWKVFWLGILFAFLTASAHVALPAFPSPQKPVGIAEKPSEDWSPPSPWPRRGQLVLWYLLAGARLLCGASAAISMLILFYHLARWPRGYEIRMDGTGLHSKRLGPVMSWRFRLPHKELEEIRLASCSNTYHLVAISDRRCLELAHGLTSGEAEYLRQVLIHAAQRG